MNTPALAILEFSSIAAGTFAADRMVKQAEVALLRTGTVHPGKYVVLLAGREAEVGVAFRAGVDAGGTRMLDEVFLPDAHADIVPALLGRRNPAAYDSLAVLETDFVAAIVRAVDAALKGAEVSLLELRIGDELGGKGLAHLIGERADVEAAVEIARTALAGRDGNLCDTIVSRIDEALSDKVRVATRFKNSGPPNEKTEPRP
jgi:microcompartment protein CcmL/EutN